MNKVNVFILSEDGTFLEKELIDILLSVIEKKFEIANVPEMNHVMMKAAFEKKKPILNAHNNPGYLLEALEESEYQPIVIAWDVNSDGMPAPKYMVGDYEINALIEALKNNLNIDAWVTTINVNKKIRAEEDNE